VTFADRFPGLERYAAIEVERYAVPATDTIALGGPVILGTRTSRVAISRTISRCAWAMPY
jgi:hypothetical protein